MCAAVNLYIPLRKSSLISRSLHIKKSQNSMGRLKYDIGIKKHSMRSGTLFKLVLAFNSQLSANQDDDELQVRKTNECSDACVRQRTKVLQCQPG